MRSMTGFGTGRASDGRRVLTFEIRSVNHRYCDVRVHLPPRLGGLEGRIEGAVRRRVDRGRVEVSLELSAEAGAIGPVIDVARARAYFEALTGLGRELGLAEGPTLALIADLPGVVGGAEGPEDLDALAPQVDRALAEALDGLTDMRRREGEALARELTGRGAEVRRLVARVGELLPKAQADRRARLEQRLSELLGDRTLDAARLAQEVAILADRADVTEELTRLSSHLAQLERLLGTAEPVGRKLDFLIQELHREVNTVGSKTTNAEIAHVVVDLKAELERMREQVQNVE